MRASIVGGADLLSRVAGVLLPLLLLTTLHAEAWAPPPSRFTAAAYRGVFFPRATTTTTRPYSTTRLYSEPKDSDDDSKQQQQQQQQRQVTSFDDAGQGLRDAEDNKRLEEMGDFDSNPDYQSDNIDKMREAIRKRTAEMGLEKSKLSQEILKEASKRAQEGAASGDNALDLTKIRGQLDPNMPSMFFDPEDEMTDEEKKQVDPVDTQNLFEQAKNEIVNSKWPDFTAALREVGVMFLVVAFTAGLIIQWDAVLRDFYTDTLHLIPTAEEIQSRFTGLDLPEGWTQSLNENDVANLPSVVRENIGGSESGSLLPDL